jgi:site-specific DNA recombinase
MLNNMVISSKPAGSAAHARTQAVLYARVSSKEQEKEGFSIAAQVKLLKDYASAEGFVIVQEYVDVETAKHTGRAAFSEMVTYLRTHPSVRVMLVEKTDRLYRNLKDWVTVDELEVEVHLPKEGVVLSRDSRSSEKFMHGIKVLMAKNYIDNLSEEARKGMQEKAEQGIWPTKAPLGYRNVASSDGRRIIEPDPQLAPMIAQVFEWYASGKLSIKELAARAREHGFRYARSGRAVPASTIHTILRNRLYSGEFDWKGKSYKGIHTPLVSPELWQCVQDILDGKKAKRLRRSKHQFAFSGLLTCGHCGCALVGEIKKQRYVYYHCTGYRGKCPERYVREEVLEAEFSRLLDRLSFDGEMLDWVRDALHESHAAQRTDQESAVARLQLEYDRLQKRLHAMYVDKLDGSISPEFFEQMSTEWRREQADCLRKMEQLRNADQTYLDDGVRLLELAMNASRLFEQQEPREKRKLLDFLLSNSTWKEGRLHPNFKQPFDLIADTASEALMASHQSDAETVKSEIWLGNQDSNLD